MAVREMALLLILTTALAKAQESSAAMCLRASNGSNSIPLFQRPSSTIHLEPNPIQALITSYQFQCCGSVATWGAYIGPENQDTIISIQFQVWRVSDGTGCYFNVGTNRFDGIELSDNRILMNVTTTDQIQVMPGDVVGYILQREVNFDLESGILFSDQNQYRNESVWYDILTEGTKQTQCINSAANKVNNMAGTLSRFSTIGPIITAQITTEECSASSESASPTLPGPETNSTILIGASVGAILGVLLLLIIVIVTLICIYTKARNSSKSDAQRPEVLYDVIAEGPSNEHNTHQVIIKTEANEAYTGITLLPLTRTGPNSDMEDNTAYMEASMAASMREEAMKEECGEYVTMAPQYDVLRHSNI